MDELPDVVPVYGLDAGRETAADKEVEEPA
jgi:hypothetical protein